MTSCPCSFYLWQDKVCLFPSTNDLHCLRYGWKSWTLALILEFYKQVVSKVMSYSIGQIICNNKYYYFFFN